MSKNERSFSPVAERVVKLFHHCALHHVNLQLSTLRSRHEHSLPSRSQRERKAVSGWGTSVEMKREAGQSSDSWRVIGELENWREWW